MIPPVSQKGKYLKTAGVLDRSRSTVIFGDRITIQGAARCLLLYCLSFLEGTFGCGVKDFEMFIYIITKNRNWNCLTFNKMPLSS